MPDKRLSIKTSLMSVIFMMGLLVVIFTILTGEVYRELIFDNQKNAFSRLAQSKVDELLKDITHQTTQLGLNIQSDNNFKSAFKQRNTQLIARYLDENFHRAFVTLNILELKKLQVYDTNMQLIAESEEGDNLFDITRSCPEFKQNILARTGSNKIKSISELCINNTEPRLTSVVPVGGLRLKGYLLITINPIKNLSVVSKKLVTPLQISLSDGSVLFQSSDWKKPGKLEQSAKPGFYLSSSRKPVLEFLFSPDTDKLISDLSMTRLYLLFAALSVTLVTIYICLALLRKYTLEPITQLTRHLKNVMQNKDHLSDKVLPRGNSEIYQLTTDLNTMSQQLHALYNTLENMAYTDSLTRMHNRAYLYEKLQNATRHANRGNDGFALFMMDLNRFKFINDTLGHHIGDLILQEVASRLNQCLRDDDTAARLGGDEFAVMLPSISDHSGALKVAKKIINSLSESIDIDNHKLNIEVSIGISICPTDSTDIHSLLKYADIAMYHCKQNNINYAFYDNSMDNETLLEFTMEPKLREAISTDQLQLYYQPKIEISSKTVTGVEALLRWHEPELGNISPDIFIPLAEKTGLIHSLTEWVLNSAYQQYIAWRSNGIDLDISVNLSSLSLNENHIIDLLEKLTKKYTGIPAEWLTLELTESTIMSDPVHALDILSKIDSMNIKLSIDDFGTGYSSLSYLKQLPVDEIKIDKSFVISMMQDSNDAVIVKSTIDLAHNMGLSVVAEGIESEDIWRSLDEMKCDLAQGFFMCKPVAPDTLTDWLNSSEYALRRTQHEIKAV